MTYEDAHREHIARNSGKVTVKLTPIKKQPTSTQREQPPRFRSRLLSLADEYATRVLDSSGKYKKQGFPMLRKIKDDIFTAARDAKTRLQYDMYYDLWGLSND